MTIIRSQSPLHNHHFAQSTKSIHYSIPQTGHHPSPVNNKPLPYLQPKPFLQQSPPVNPSHQASRSNSGHPQPPVETPSINLPRFSKPSSSPAKHAISQAIASRIQPEPPEAQQPPPYFLPPDTCTEPRLFPTASLPLLRDQTQTSAPRHLPTTGSAKPTFFHQQLPQAEIAAQPQPQHQPRHHSSAP